jgi:6,7-dimethyl-8-ribityllumazine synthase
LVPAQFYIPVITTSAVKVDHLGTTPHHRIEDSKLTWQFHLDDLADGEELRQAQKTISMASLKGPGAAQKHDGESTRPIFPSLVVYSVSPEIPQVHQPAKQSKPLTPSITGSDLRIAIVHARWNTTVISSLVSATRAALLESGVSPANIITESVPGSYELPFACQKLIAASHIQASPFANIAAGISSGVAGLGSATQDLLGGDEGTSTNLTPEQQQQQRQPSLQSFDAVIAIGVLIKGETMHFEYIADAVSHGLMRVQLDTGVPVVFGLLTVLTEDQALARAGMAGGHNHGTDWGNAAVELGSKRRGWENGKFS